MLEQPTDNELANVPLDTHTWGDAGHDGGNQVLQTLQNFGMDFVVAEEILGEAAYSRDASLVDQKALIKSVGKARAAKIMKGLTQYVGHLKGQEQNVANAVFPVVNGKANWGKIVDHAQATLSPQQWNTYEKELSKGGNAATKAAEILAAGYRKGSAPQARVTSTATPAAAAAATAAAHPSGVGITRAQMVTQLDSLHSSSLPPAAIAKRDRAIRQARNLGKQNGL
jgi:hypothetical protein